MQALNLFDLAEKTKVKKMIKIADLKPINNLKLIISGNPGLFCW
jgi:hypothetical protein